MKRTHATPRRPWILTAGLAASLVLLWWLGDSSLPGGQRLRAARLGRTAATVLPGLRVAAAGQVRPAVGHASPASEARPQAPPSDLPSGVGAWIRVEVRPAVRGEDLRGVAYALRAGEPGVDDCGLVPRVQVSSERPGLLPLPAAGRYDVGFAWDQHHLLEQDVRVSPGETAHVAFREPATQPVILDLVDPLPEFWEGWILRAKVSMQRVGDATTAELPGRDQCRGFSWSGVLTQAGQARIGALTQRDRVGIRVVLEGQRGHPDPAWAYPKTHVPVCSPCEAAGGDRVRVTLQPAGLLIVRAAVDLTAWPTGAQPAVEVEVHGVGGVQRDRHRLTPRILSRATDATGPFVELRYALLPGPAHVSWGGPDVQPGECGSLLMRAAEAEMLPIAFRPLPRLQESVRPLRLSVLWPPGVDAEASLRVSGPLPPGLGPARGFVTESADRDRALATDFARLRALTALEAVIGDTWCSGPLAVPEGDELLVSFQRGGLLVLAPEIARPWNMGRFVLRRSDGLLFHTSGEVHSQISILAGTVLGPFLPGVHTFQVWLGNRRLADVSALVQAGRTTPLAIR